jgi:hypothetical protein
MMILKQRLLFIYVLFGLNISLKVVRRFVRTV